MDHCSPGPRCPALGPAQPPVLSSPSQLVTPPGFKCIQRAIECHIIPLPCVDLIVADVGKAVDDVGAEEVVDGIREAAPIAFPILGPVGVVADQLV